MVRNTLEIHSKLQIITNRNLSSVRGMLMLPASASERLANSLYEQFNYTIGSGSIMDRPKWVKENRDRRVSRRELNHAGNLRILESTKSSEHFA